MRGGVAVFVLMSFLLAGFPVALAVAALGAATPVDRGRRVMLAALLYIPGAAGLALAACAAGAR